MKNFTKFLSICLFALLTPLVAGCNETSTSTSTSDTEQPITFNFDDEYFIGMQEHFYEIRAMEKTCTAPFIADLNKAIGSKVFRLNCTLNNLFIVDIGDKVRFNSSTVATMRYVVDLLVESGVERIVYITDSFIYPYGYSATHTICAPDPYSEREAYERWVKVIGDAYGLIAQEFPEINYFEMINEPDIPTNEVLCRNGMLWGTQDPNFMFSAWDEANILADLNYYCRKAVKAVNPNNKMMTAALTSLNTCYDYLEQMYKAIESGAHPIGDEPCSVNPDDYFDIVSLHPYAFAAANVDPLTPTEEGVYIVNDNYALACQKFYDICCNHGDAEKPHWYTEIGFTDNGSDAAAEIAGREMAKQITLIKEKLPFVESIILYKMTNFAQYSVSIPEDNFGLCRAIADEERPLELKPIMKAIYSYMHDGSTDYSAFDEVRAKYAPQD